MYLCGGKGACVLAWVGVGAIEGARRPAAAINIKL